MLKIDAYMVHKKSKGYEKSNSVTILQLLLRYY